MTTAINHPEGLQSPFGGTGVALATPFDLEGKIDYPSLERLLARVLKAKLDNLILFGTTGESPTISPEEKAEVLDFVKVRTKGTSCNLIVGLSSNNTATLVETIRTFDFQNIHGILTSTPYYNKPSQEGIYRHFAEIAKVSPRPMIIYNIPSRTGCDILPKTLLRLRQDFPNKIVAVKESGGKVERVSEVCKLIDDDFTVLSGDDCHTLEFIREGAKGAISVVANAFPELVKEIIDGTLSGDPETLKYVTQLDKVCADLYHVLFEDGNPGGIKCLLKEMGIFSTETLRLPLVPVCTETRLHIKEILPPLQRYRDLE